MMIIKLGYNGKNYSTDLSKPIDISIPLKNGSNNPSCYWADSPEFKTIEVGNFIGDVSRGGSVNHKKIEITPHGNGTHTETYGHISKEPNATIHHLLKEFHCVAQLITLEPVVLKNGDRVLTYDSFARKFSGECEAIIIRTSPNDDEKLNRNYSGSNPPYLDAKITSGLNEKGIKHLLVDLPSVDREEDGGKLEAHHAFWDNKNGTRDTCSITELIYVNNNVLDGLYFLNVQTLNIDLDASPSRPVIYKLELC